MNDRSPGEKGLLAEEALRNYFLDAGYFVVRGVPLQQDGQDVTDVDLWLYSRASALHRVRANVDVKCRVKSKAFERVLWAKGLQSILRVDDAIVATTDRRVAVKTFAKDHGVKVLDGDFLQRLEGRVAFGRVSEEKLSEIIDEQGMDRIRGGWRDRLRSSKARLATHLDFRGCNYWLGEACYFLGRFAAQERENSALRATYLNLSYFHLGLDFRYQSIAFEPEDVRRAALLHGFRYGEHDMQLIHSLLRDVSPQLGRELGAATSAGREALLAQYYCDIRIVGKLYETARRFEAAAFAENIASPDGLDPESKAIIGVIADYCAIDRKQVLRSIPAAPGTG